MSNLRILAPAVGLVVALLIVFYFDRNPDQECTVLPAAMSATKNASTVLRMGVTPREYDDLGGLLRSLGSGYEKYTDLSMPDLLDPAAFSQLDVLFLTCGTVPMDWLEGDETPSGRANTVSRPPRIEIFEKLSQNLREFVERGGTIYASDWRYSIVSHAFNEFQSPGEIPKGAEQVVTANVLDPGLSALVGTKIDLNFDQPDWYPAAFSGSKVTPILSGSFQDLNGGTQDMPLLVKFPYGKGAVIFTAFHNEKVNSAVELELLRYLVFSAVTAQSENAAIEEMELGKFTTDSNSILTSSNPKSSGTYSLNSAATLRFTLAFRQQGALLKLSLRGPDGKCFEREGDISFSIDVENAAPGDWSYSITPIHVPHENFPFQIFIGSKK